MSAVQSKEHLEWAEIEDNLLMQIVRLQGTVKWSRVADAFNVRSPRKNEIYRSSKNCRERWTNHLDTEVVKGEWQFGQDYQLVSLIKQRGKKWNYISKKLSRARTQNAVKNRYNALIRQYQKKSRELSEQQAFVLVYSQLSQRMERQASMLGSFEQDIEKKEERSSAAQFVQTPSTIKKQDRHRKYLFSEQDDEQFNIIRKARYMKPVTASHYSNPDTYVPQEYLVRQQQPCQLDPAWKIALVHLNKQLLYYVNDIGLSFDLQSRNQQESPMLTKTECGEEWSLSERNEVSMQLPTASAKNHLLLLSPGQSKLVLNLNREQAILSSSD